MIGQTISHYKITEKLGEGGMGVVYKAEDTKLERPVALKFLPPHLLGNEEVRIRFEREAKAAAALHHPNICPVYEIDEVEGKAFIAMAFIEGESLDKKIAQGPLKLDDALDIAQQIATGLEAAHEKGIFHRDIKPENLIVNAKGHVTIMDFGLAQLAEASRLTRDDTTLGTVAYMSPEQTEGSGTDHRTDIWSLGVVLYEMITGQRPFKGDYDKAVMYSIINEQPDPLTALRTGVPMELDVLVGKALTKAIDERHQSATEMIAELKGLSRKLRSGRSLVAERTFSPATDANDSKSSPPKALAPKRSLRIYQIAFGATTAALVLLTLLYVNQPQPRSPVRKFTVLPPSLYSRGAIARRAVISPNGLHIVWVSGEQPSQLWVRDFDDETPRLVEGTEGARPRPFWSPDSKFIAFADDDTLRKVPLEGGPIAVICRLINRVYSGGTWAPEGDEIVFSTGGRDLYVVSAGGGDPRLLSEPLETEKGSAHHAPHFLPSRASARAILYDVGSRADRDIAMENLETGERRIVVEGASAVYSPTGHIVFNRTPGGGGLWALPFSIETLQPAGDAFPIAEGVGEASIAHDGTLIYIDSLEDQQLVWRDRLGRKLEAIGQPQNVILFPDLSPDGGRVAVEAFEGEGSDIWLHEVGRSIKQRITFDPGSERYPVWSPSGREVAFVSYPGGSLAAVSSSGDGEPLLMWSSESDASVYPQDWSHDGKRLLFLLDADLWFLEKQPDGEYLPQAFIQSPFSERSAKISPDGRYVAYCSDQSGRNEVYVTQFPSDDERRQVSERGACSPQWRPDGKELYFVEGDTLMAVSINTDLSLSLGSPRALFSDPTTAPGGGQPSYDVAADGERFVMVERVGQGSTSRRSIHVVQNWYEQFRTRE